MVYIEKICPICGEGSIAFRKCASAQKIVLMCDECDSVWLNPTLVFPDTVIYPQAPEFYIPTVDCSLKSPNSTWATIDEIRDYGWHNYVFGSNDKS